MEVKKLASSYEQVLRMQKPSKPSRHLSPHEPKDLERMSSKFYRDSQTVLNMGWRLQKLK